MLLLCGQRLAFFSGYDLDDVARAFETLIHAGLVERRQSRSRAACIYVLVRVGRSGEWLASLLAIASTPGGRAEVLQALAPGCGPEEEAADTRPARARSG